MGKTSRAAVVVNGPIAMILVPKRLAVIKHVQNTTLITKKVRETVFFMILVFYEVNKHSAVSKRLINKKQFDFSNCFSEFWRKGRDSNPRYG